MPAFHHIVRHGFPFSTFKTTKPFVQKIARIAVVRNLGHGPIQRGTRRHIPAVWRTLLHDNGRDVVQRQGSHHLIEGPVRAILPMRARHEVPGAAVTETRQAKREILSDHTRGKKALLHPLTLHQVRTSIVRNVTYRTAMVFSVSLWPR